MKYDLYTDAELLQHFRKNEDTKWIGVLFERYAMLVFGVCLKYLRNSTDAEDAVQQIFEKVIHEIPKYEIPYFKSWIYSVAKNYCLMEIRRKSTRPFLMDEMPEHLAADIQNEQELKLKEWVLEERIQNLKSALSELNNEQSTCINLFYIQKLSYYEIEQKTGMAFKEIKSHIQNGKRNLKNILGQKKDLS